MRTCASVPGRSSFAEAAVPEEMRELIADAGEPELPALRSELDRVVFQNGDAGIGERAAHGGDFVPPVMIAEDRPDAERSLKPRKLGRQSSVGQALGLEPVPRDVVAEQDDEVGIQSIGGVDHVLHVRHQHIRPAGMEVGDHGDGQLAARRPGRQRGRVASDDWPCGSMAAA